MIYFLCGLNLVQQITCISVNKLLLRKIFYKSIEPPVNREKMEYTIKVTIEHIFVFNRKHFSSKREKKNTNFLSLPFTCNNAFVDQ